MGRSSFWWGKAGAGPFKALWRFEFDYFTRGRGLNHLVWVYSTLDNPVNGWSGNSADGYPGDDVVEVVGSDIYRDGLTSDHNTAWSTCPEALRTLGGGRLVALTAPLESGNYTAQITAAAGGSGEALIEIHALGTGGPSLATHPPGAYTVQLGSTTMTGGVGLVEIYTVP